MNTVIRGGCFTCEYAHYPEDSTPCVSCLCTDDGFTNFKPKEAGDAKYAHLNRWAHFFSSYGIPTEIIEDKKYLALRLNRDSPCVDSNIDIGEYSQLVIDIDFDLETGEFIRIGTWDV